MDLREIDQDELRRLDRLGGADRWVLSVYLGIDPPHAPDAHERQAELEARLTDAERRLRGEGVADAEPALEACLSRVREELGDVPPPDHTVRGVAVFCEDSGELRAFWIRRPPEYEAAAAFGRAPAVEPLMEALPGPRWAVGLVSRKHGRIFVGTDLALVEVGEVDDDVHRRHSKGGWAQARFQRGVEKETEDHVARVCDRLFALHGHRPVDRLAIGGPAEILPLVEAELHPYLRERLAGQVEIDVEHPAADRVLERIRPLIDEERARREREAIDRVREGLGTGSRSVAGLDAVLAALDEKRVGTLLVARGSFDGEFERAVEAARAQSAEIVVIEGEALDSLGEIAALLRF